MAEIKFGTKQIGNPTPASINLWVRIISVTGLVFISWMATATIMGPKTKDVVNQVLGLVLGLINVLAPLFGVQVSGKVDVSEVTAVDETKVN